LGVRLIALNFGIRVEYFYGGQPEKAKKKKHKRRMRWWRTTIEGKRTISSRRRASTAARNHLTKSNRRSIARYLWKKGRDRGSKHASEGAHILLAKWERKKEGGRSGE